MASISKNTKELFGADTISYSICSNEIHVSIISGLGAYGVSMDFMRGFIESLKSLESELMGFNCEPKLEAVHEDTTTMIYHNHDDGDTIKLECGRSWQEFNNGCVSREKYGVYIKSYNGNTKPLIQVLDKLGIKRVK